MKKLIISLIILIIVGGVVFFFGWINIFVPAGSYAVMVSKTSGFDATLVRPASGLVWRWENVIPANMTIHCFTLDEQNVALSSKGALPSAEVYAAAAPFTPQFTYDINFNATFRLRPEALIGLVEDHSLTPDTLDAYYAAKKETINALILEQILKINESQEASLLTDPGSLGTDLLAKIGDKFTDIQITSVTPRGVIRMPDPTLYLEAKKAYLAILEEKRALEIAKLRQGAELYGNADILFERSVTQLEKYGELLDKYPVLLKYLFITGATNPAAAQLPEIKELFDTGGSN